MTNNTVDPLYTANLLNVYFSEDSDEMLQIAAFHQGLHCCQFQQMAHLDIPGNKQTRISLPKSDQDYVTNNTVEHLYMGNLLKGYFGRQ